MLFLGLMIPRVEASGIDDWKDQILYFVMIDRFANGNPANDSEVDQSDLQGFHGGDLAGLLKNLDYLKDLGITGLWISPFFTNRPDRFFKHQPYHGYWVHDFWSVDSRFGEERELIELREQLTGMNMKLLLDMVVNHMGYDAPFAAANPDWFNPPLDIIDWNNPDQLCNRRIFGLPDFASQKPVVKTFFRLVARHWLEKLQPDGFRLDAVKHVPLDFWRDFNSCAARQGGKKFMLLGEYLNGDPQAMLEIWRSGNFISLFDFPLYYTMKEVFAESGDCRKLASRIYFDRNYPDAGLLATFLDNHDLDRFITSCGKDQKKYRLALAYLMTSRGIPTLCYGDEQGLEGAHDPLPYNRRSMQFDRNNDLFTFTRDLICLRKSSDALRRGMQCHIYADATACVYGRLTPDSLAIIAINNGEEPRRIDTTLPFNVEGGKKVLDAAFGSARAILRDGRLETFLPGRSFAVFMPASSPGFYEKTFRHWQRRFYHEKAWGSRKITLKLKVDYLPEKAEVFVIGNAPELGDWNIKQALPMQKVADDEYEAVIKMPLGKIFECKCFYRNEGETIWQNGDNTVGEIIADGGEYLHLSWKTMQ